MNTGFEAARADPFLMARELDEYGHCNLGPLLSKEEIDALKALYSRSEPFRSHIVMARHGFGSGEYKYFNYPLPEPVARLRKTLYPPLATVANRWCEQLRVTPSFPDTHVEFLEQCNSAGQKRPTPLLLKYEAGDYNCLHQDLYGEIAFPIQVVILLSDPACFSGGELVLTEQRPRMQSRAEVVALKKGHGVAFAVNERPRQGKNGFYRVRQRHGVSRVRTGTRHALGIIFHDAL